MTLTASESKRLEALRAKASPNAKEQAEMAELEAKLHVPNKEVVNPPATAIVVGIAEIKLRDDMDKPVLVRLVEPVGDTEILLLSAKQANALAQSINIFTTGVEGWRLMKATVGNRRSEVELSVQKQVSGSTYVDRSGVIVTRDTDGYSVLPQTLILPMEVQNKLDTDAVRAVSASWKSSARFLPKSTNVAEEDGDDR